KRCSWLMKCIVGRTWMAELPKGEGPDDEYRLLCVLLDRCQGGCSNASDSRCSRGSLSRHTIWLQFPASIFPATVSSRQAVSRAFPAAIQLSGELSCRCNRNS